MNESIIRKVQNLLNRTTDKGASVEEMETCIKIAHNLMEKYALSLEDLKTNDITIKEGTETDIQTKNAFDFLYMAQAIAKLFHCEVVSCKRNYNPATGELYRRSRRSFRIVGEEQHIAVVEFILAEIFINVTELFHQYSKDNKLTLNNVLKEKYSYERGYFKAVRDKATTLYEERNNVESSGTALMIIDSAVSEYMTRYKARSLGSTRRRYSEDGYNAGYSQGKNQALNTRFNRKGTNKLTCNL